MKKLAMSLLVRDEIDIIKSHIAYHIPKVDLLIVTDNCSRDGTREYLESIKSDKIIILDQPKLDYAQSSWVGQMIKMAADMGADWIVNSDADEFWIGDIRKEIEEKEKSSVNIINVGSYNMRATYLDDIAQKDSALRMCWREAAATPGFTKVIHATRGFHRILQGNHKVSMYPTFAPKTGEASGVYILHYCHRSWTHFKRKYIQGGQAYANNSITHNTGLGAHWVAKYELYKRQGEDGLFREFVKDYVYNQDELFRQGIIKDTTVIDVLNGAVEKPVVIEEQRELDEKVLVEIRQNFHGELEGIMQRELDEKAKQILSKIQENNRAIMEVLDKAREDARLLQNENKQFVVDEMKKQMVDNRLWSRLKKLFGR